MGGGYKNKVTPNKNKTLLIVLGIFALVIVTTAASFAFFTYSRTGNTKATIISGDIEFSYIEGESATLTNAFPVKDSIGAIDEAGEYEFQVKMKSSSENVKVDYNVYLVDNNGGSDKYFTNEQIKFALIKNDVYVANTSATSGVKLSELAGFNEGSSVGEGMVLENQEISNDVTDYYKLRIWISDDVNYSNTSNIDDNTDENNDSETSVGKYNGYKYSLKVKVTSEIASSTTIINLSASDRGVITAEVSDPNGLSAYAVTTSSSTPHDNEWIDITNETAKSNIVRTTINKVTSKKISYSVATSGSYYLHVKNVANQIIKKKIVVEINIKTLNQMILENNTVSEKTATLSMTSLDSGENGLYKTTATNNGEPSYFFRGNVENNYVSFAGFTWRIVRINEDGTIRLSMTSGINDNAVYRYAYAATPYTTMYYTNSNAKDQLESWFNTYIKEKQLDDKVATGDYYCQHMLDSASDSDLKCETDTYGMGIVNSYIGLITYEELIHAGCYPYKINQNYHLYTGFDHFTMTAHGVYNKTFAVKEAGTNYITSAEVYSSSLRLVPVINLKAFVTASGSGLVDDKYIID